MTTKKVQLTPKDYKYGFHDEIESPQVAEVGCGHGGNRMPAAETCLALTRTNRP